MGMESRDEFSDRNLLSQVELKIESLRAFFFFYRFEDHWWENRVENRGNSRRICTCRDYADQI